MRSFGCWLGVHSDGGSYSGNNATPTMVSFNGSRTMRPLYYRGSRNLDAALATLVKDWGMGDATDVLISGVRMATASSSERASS